MIITMMIMITTIIITIIAIILTLVAIIIIIIIVITTVKIRAIVMMISVRSIYKEFGRLLQIFCAK